MKTRLEVIKRQFLKALPLDKVEFDGFFKNLDWNGQEKFIQSTILHTLNVNKPVRVDYQISFIKHAILQLEVNNNEEIHDLLYEKLAEKLNEDKPEFSYKHFVIHDETDAITIKESNSLIQDGTTGLRLWPAALALGEFILQNRDIFDGKTILEIGSGCTGFVGLLLLKACQPKMVLLSDGHDAVVDNLIENVNLNLEKAEVKSESKSILIRKHLKLKSSGAEFAVLNMAWEDVAKHEVELKNFCNPNVLIAADVVYDDTIFDALISCINQLFEMYGASMNLYLSTTIRNPKTYQQFCHLLQNNSFKTTEEDKKFGDISTFEASTEIKILRISKTQATHA